MASSSSLQRIIARARSRTLTAAQCRPHSTTYCASSSASSCSATKEIRSLSSLGDEVRRSNNNANQWPSRPYRLPSTTCPANRTNGISQSRFFSSESTGSPVAPDDNRLLNRATALEKEYNESISCPGEEWKTEAVATLHKLAGVGSKASVAKFFILLRLVVSKGGRGDNIGIDTVNRMLTNWFSFPQKDGISVKWFANSLGAIADHLPPDHTTFSLILNAENVEERNDEEGLRAKYSILQKCPGYNLQHLKLLKECKENALIRLHARLGDLNQAIGYARQLEGEGFCMHEETFMSILIGLVVTSDIPDNDAATELFLEWARVQYESGMLQVREETVVLLATCLTEIGPWTDEDLPLRILTGLSFVTQSCDSDTEPESSDESNATTVAQLKALCKESGLKVTGKKADLQERIQEHVDTMTVVQLKALCRERGLKVAGLKADLKERIQEHLGLDSNASDVRERASLAAKPTLDDYASAIKFWTAAGDTKTPIALLRYMEESESTSPNLDCYNAVLSGVWRSQKADAGIIASDILARMTESLDNAPNYATYRLVIACLSNAGHQDAAKQAMAIAREMIDESKKETLSLREPDMFFFRLAFNVVKADLGVTEEWIDWREEEARVGKLWVPWQLCNDEFRGLLSAIRQFSHVSTAATKSLAILERMERLVKEGVLTTQPDRLMYATAIRCLRSSGEADIVLSAEKILSEHEDGKIGGSLNSRYLYKGVIDLLGSMGDASKAEEMLARYYQRMQKSYPGSRAFPNTHDFNSVLLGWANSDAPRAAERASALVDHMKKLDGVHLDSTMPNQRTYDNLLLCWKRSHLPVAEERAKGIGKLLLEKKGLIL